MAENIQLAGLVVDLLLNTASFEAGSTKAQRIANKAAKDIDREFRAVQGVLSGILSRLGPIGESAAGALDQVGSAAAKAMEKIGGMGKGVGIVGAGVAALGAAAAATSAAVISIAAHAAESAAKLEDMAHSTGVSVEALSELQAVGHMIAPDIDIDTIAKGLERMDRAALRSVQETTLASDGFATLGVKVRDAAGHMKDTAVLFSEIASKFANMADGSEKTAVAMEIFGRSGAALIPILDEGGGRIDHIIKMANSFGAVIGTQTAEAAHKFKENMAALELAFQGMENRVMEALLPSLQALTHEFDQMAEGAMVTDQQILDLTDGFGVFQTKADGLQSSIKGIVDMVKFWVPWMVDITAALASASEQMAGFMQDLAILTEYAKGKIPGGFAAMKKAIQENNAVTDAASQHWLNLADQINAALDAPTKPRTGFDVLNDLEESFRKMDAAKHHVNLDIYGGSQDSTAQLLSQMKQLQAETDSLIHKNDSAAEKELRSIEQLTTKWKDYGTTWSEAHKGINTVVNQEIEALENERAAIEANISSMQKLLSMGLVPGAKPPELGDMLTGVGRMPVFSGGDFAKQLNAIKTNDQAAQTAADHIISSIGDENEKYSEQMVILEELRNQGKLTQEQFQTAAEKAGEAIVKEWQGAFDRIGNAFQTLINGWLQGTQTVGQAFRKMGDALLTSILSAQVKQLEGSIAEKAAKTAGQPGVAGSIYSVIGKIFGVKDKLATPGSSPSNPIFTKSVDALPGVNPSSLSSLALSKAPSGISSILSGLTTVLPFMAAGGGQVSGPGTSISDSVPAMLSAGEYVLRADAVKRVGKTHLDAINAGHSIARFAAGGTVTPGASYLASERQPFAFVPNSGQILPSMSTGEGSSWDGPPELHQHFHGMQDMDTFKRSKSQMAGWMSESLYSARRNK